MKLIIDSKTKRLRNKIDLDNDIYGIYGYILGEGWETEVPEGHETVEGEIEDFSGMWLPKWTKKGWVESASEDEIAEIITLSSGDVFSDPSHRAFRDIVPIEEQIQDTQIALMELYEALIKKGVI